MLRGTYASGGCCERPAAGTASGRPAGHGFRRLGAGKPSIPHAPGVLTLIPTATRCPDFSIDLSRPRLLNYSPTARTVPRGSHLVPISWLVSCLSGPVEATDLAHTHPHILAAFCPTLTLRPGCAHPSSPTGCGKPLCAHSMLSALTMSKSLPPAESRVIGGMRPEQPRRTKALLGPGRTKDFRRPLPGWCCSRRLFLVPHATAGGWPATPASHVRSLDLSFMLVPIRP